VITPTGDREHFLQGTYLLLKNQRYTNWEWLIYDTSLKPTRFEDPRITYIYDEGIVTIGEKRNRLIEKASGEVIVHFDDDDYYAATYLEHVLHYLKKASFFTLHAWFSYDAKTRQFFYWNTEELAEVSYCLSPLSGSRVREIELGPYMQKQRAALNYKGKTGYGFSFAYMKEVARTCTFQDIDLSEDHCFYKDVENAGFLMTTAADQKGEAIHVIHESNTSAEFPQYRIPQFLVQNLFPPFFSYLECVYKVI
jgi:Glycosyl transferase family 2